MTLRARWGSTGVGSQAENRAEAWVKAQRRIMEARGVMDPALSYMTDHQLQTAKASDAPSTTTASAAAAPASTYVLAPTMDSFRPRLMRLYTDTEGCVCSAAASIAAPAAAPTVEPIVVPAAEAKAEAKAAEEKVTSAPTPPLHLLSLSLYLSLSLCVCLYTAAPRCLRWRRRRSKFPQARG